MSIKVRTLSGEEELIDEKDQNKYQEYQYGVEIKIGRDGLAVPDKSHEKDEEEINA